MINKLRHYVRKMVVEELSATNLGSTRVLKEGLSSILYHGTQPRIAVTILKTDKFKMTPSKTAKEKSLSGGKKYFGSFARSLTSMYKIFRYDDVPVCVFVVDGRKLQTKYSGQASDYFSKKKDRHNFDEMEDRVTSDNQYIEKFSSYVNELRVWIPDIDDPNNWMIEPVMKELPDIINLCDSKGIPLRVYSNGNRAAYMLGKASKSIPVSMLHQYIKAYKKSK